MPPITRLLIAVNVVAFLATMALGDALVAPFALWPLGTGFMPWQLVTYAFVHGGLTHLLFNMFALYMFGSDLERVWGGRRYLTYYGLCVLSAAATQLVFSALAGAQSPTVGASGGVFGLLLAFAMVFPQRTIVPLFPPIPMRAPVFVAVYGALELLFGVTGTVQGVAHFAHLGGLAGGFLLMRAGRRRR